MLKQRLVWYHWFRYFHTFLARPVARFWGLEGQNTFLGGHKFCFYYIFETKFSGIGNKKIWGGTKEIWGHCTRMHHRGDGPVFSIFSFCKFLKTAKIVNCFCLTFYPLWYCYCTKVIALKQWEFDSCTCERPQYWVVKFWLFLTRLAGQNPAFFCRKGLTLTKHCLSCIFITNIFWRKSIYDHAGCREYCKDFTVA